MKSTVKKKLKKASPIKAKPAKKANNPAAQQAKKATGSRRVARASEPAKKASTAKPTAAGTPKNTPAKPAGELSSADLLSKIGSRISNLDGEEKRVIDQQVQLEAQKRKLFAEMVQAKKKQIRDTEAKLNTRQLDLDKKEQAVAHARAQMDARLREVAVKSEEIEKKLQEEKVFHKALGDYLNKQKQHHAEAAKVIEGHRRQTLEMQKVRALLLSKEKQLNQMEEKILSQDRTVPLQKKISLLQEQLTKKSEAYDRFRRLSDGEVNKLRSQVKELSKKPRTVVRRVADQAAMKEKLAQQARELEARYRKLADKQSTVLDPKVRTALKELAAVVLKLPEKKLEPLFDSKNFPVVREVLQKYKIE